MDKTLDLSIVNNKVGAFDTYKGPKAGKNGDVEDTLPNPPLEYFFLLLLFFFNLEIHQNNKGTLGGIRLGFIEA